MNHRETDSKLGNLFVAFSVGHLCAPAVSSLTDEVTVHVRKSFVVCGAESFSEVRT